MTLYGGTGASSDIASRRRSGRARPHRLLDATLRPDESVIGGAIRTSRRGWHPADGAVSPFDSGSPESNGGPYEQQPSW
jgi:hypothetical protein